MKAYLAGGVASDIFEGDNGSFGGDVDLENVKRFLNNMAKKLKPAAHNLFVSDLSAVSA
jgi:hypothetical protein